MLLQQCTVKTVVLTAIETQCGFQPFFTLLARIIHWEWTDGPFIHTPHVFGNPIL
jgi:hypothetical protein